MFKEEHHHFFKEYTGKINDYSGQEISTLELGEALEVAFHDKENIKNLAKLVCEDKAPVNYRLSYGLEIQKEADFVYSLYILLGGDVAAEKNTELLPKRYQNIYPYIKTSKTIYEILHYPNANLTPISVTPNFINFIRENALYYRSEPRDPDGSLTNGSLIIAAGLRNHSLMEEIIHIGKNSDKNVTVNGAHVDFQGYFNEPAIAWSAILLDEKGFNLLLKHHASLENIGMTKSSILHWLISSILINPSHERCQTGARMIQSALKHGANPCSENLFGKRPIDYINIPLPEISDLLLTQSKPKP